LVVGQVLDYLTMLFYLCR